MLPLRKLKEYIALEYYMYKDQYTYTNIQYRRINQTPVSYMNKVNYDTYWYISIHEKKYYLQIIKATNGGWFRYKLTINLKLPNYDYYTHHKEYYIKVHGSKYLWYVQN
jgi:hypothetical protein